MRDNRFLAFDAPQSGTLFPPTNRVGVCVDNTLLFAGSEAEWQQALLGGCDDDWNDGLCDGHRMVELADCYTVITKPDTQSEADFLAAEYLDNGNAQGLIPPGASVRLKLEIADPGQEAVGFEFEFY